MFATPLTSAHTLISLAAILVGIPAIRFLLGRAGPDRWTLPFLILAILTTVTGFLFPLIGVTPAFVTGIIATILLALVLLARFVFHGSGVWRAVGAIGLVANLYLLVFVLIAQLFQKVSFLNALAPNGTEPPFAIAQIICLLAFLWIGFKAVRSGRARLA